MRAAMANAEVGDDVFGDEPTVQRLEARVAEMLGKEAALFVPSGTMANQLAVRAHTESGDEILIDANAHTYYYEAGGPAALSGMCGVKGKRVLDRVSCTPQPAGAVTARRGRDALPLDIGSYHWLRLVSLMPSAITAVDITPAGAVRGVWKRRVGKRWQPSWGSRFPPSAKRTCASTPSMPAKWRSKSSLRLEVSLCGPLSPDEPPRWSHRRCRPTRGRWSSSATGRPGCLPRCGTWNSASNPSFSNAARTPAPAASTSPRCYARATGSRTPTTVSEKAAPAPSPMANSTPAPPNAARSPPLTKSLWNAVF